MSTILKVRFAWCAVLLAFAPMGALSCFAQRSLHVDHGDAAELTPGLRGVPATKSQTASLTMALPEADAHRRGEAWFTFTAVYTDPATRLKTPVTVSVPLSSTEYPYGEERTCDVNDTAHPHFLFSAGLDEKNYLAYRGSADAPHAVAFSLNKYLCRVLAAPFRCGSRTVSFSRDLSRWTLASQAGVTLSADAPATLRSTPVRVKEGGAFDIAQCAMLAPSNGLCCVQGKTTEWHCGGTPTGNGWHQVSGECFHRETGGSCKD